MKPSMLILLLLLSLLIHETQGIRLITNGAPLDGQNIIDKTFHGRSDGVEEVILCNGNHCSRKKSIISGRWVRKLLVSAVSSTITIAKVQIEKNKEKIGTKKENLSINSSSTAEHQQPTVMEAYPGVLDIAGMDYSQARRKPPIHN